MKTIFADTHYLIAIAHQLDQWHVKAKEVSKDLQPFHLLTTESVLLEMLNFLLNTVRSCDKAPRILPGIFWRNRRPTLFCIHMNLFWRGLRRDARARDQRNSHTRSSFCAGRLHGFALVSSLYFYEVTKISLPIFLSARRHLDFVFQCAAAACPFARKAYFLPRALTRMKETNNA